MWLWCTIALLITAANAANIFHTCNDEPFCAKFRGQVLDANTQFYANITGVEQNELNAVNVPLVNGNGDTLTLELSILFGHKLRARFFDDFERYQIQFILPLSKEDYPPTINKTDDTATITTTWAVEDKIIVRKGPPFTVECYYNDQLEMVLNGDRLVMENTATSKAFSFAMEFEGASKLYGLAHHSHTIALGETADGSSEPFRLKNVDNSGYDANSPMALSGSVPAVYGHSAKFTSGMFLHNAAQIFVDISYTGTRPSAYFMAECGIFDIIFFLGPTPRDVVRQYTSMTGVTRMPQLWVLGYHQNRYSYTSDDVKEVITRMDEADFPMDVVYLDGGYSNANKYFEWNPENFSDPLGLQEYVAQTGRYLVIVSNPHMAFDLDYSVYVDGKQLDYYVKLPNGSDYKDMSVAGESTWIDFLNPDARTWYAFLFSFQYYPGTTQTIGGICNDLNEPSLLNDETERTFPPDVQLYDQIEDREVHNLYGFLHAKATEAGLSIRDLYERRVFVLSRSHFAGTQKYAGVWTGDNISEWPHLRNSISEALTLNLLGIVLCGANIGGSYSDPTDELLQRWYQVAIWIPYFRAHSNGNTTRREPYRLAQNVQSVIRLAIKTRYKHLPYFYRLMFDHTQSGDPLIRPLFYSYPEYLEHDDHMMIGEDILSTPVLGPGVSQIQVSFPGNGIWYRVDDDSWTIYEGGSEQIVHVNITTSPYFYRGGSIIPRWDFERPSTSQLKNDPFQLYVTLDSENNASGLLYLDDYVTLQYRTKISYYYSRLTFDSNTNGIRFTLINGIPDGFSVRIQRIIVNKPGENKNTITTSYTATSDGTPLEEIDINRQMNARTDKDFTIYL